MDNKTIDLSKSRLDKAMIITEDPPCIEGGLRYHLLKLIRKPGFMKKVIDGIEAKAIETDKDAIDIIADQTEWPNQADQY